MQTEEIPNTDNNYNSLLKISSEEDLFVEDEVQESRNTLQ